MRNVFKEYSISSLIISRLIDFALVVPKLLMLKVCEIIEISNRGFQRRLLTVDCLLLALKSATSSLHKKWSYPLRIPPVNVTKSAVSCGFGHIY